MRLYSSYVPARSPLTIFPASKSAHNTRLSPVYGAGPYVVSHQFGFTEKPNISQGWECGRSVS